MKSTTNDQSPIQFSLKRMFVVTALVAGLAWLWRQEPVSVTVFSTLLVCFVAATIGSRRHSSPIAWGSLAGLLCTWFIITIVVVERRIELTPLGFNVVVAVSFVGLLCGTCMGIVARTREFQITSRGHKDNRAPPD